MKKIVVLIISFLGYSCNQTSDLSYNTNKVEYDRAANCLLSNYASVFELAGTKSSMVVYYSGFKENKICLKSISILLQKQAINTVSLTRDSTIWFSSKPKGAIKSIQSTLVYSNDRNKLDKKLTSVVKLKNIIGGGWYELEEVVSAAN